jgi:hypothetical protein
MNTARSRRFVIARLLLLLALGHVTVCVLDGAAQVVIANDARARAEVAFLERHEAEFRLHRELADSARLRQELAHERRMLRTVDR